MSRFISLSSTSRILGMGGGGLIDRYYSSFSKRACLHHGADLIGQLLAGEAALLQDADDARGEEIAHLRGDVHRTDHDDRDLGPDRISYQMLKELEAIHAGHLEL